MPLLQEILGGKLVLNRWEPTVFGATKTYVKRQLLGEMAVMRSGRALPARRGEILCRVCPIIKPRDTKMAFVEMCKYTHTQTIYA